MCLYHLVCVHGSGLYGLEEELCGEGECAAWAAYLSLFNILLCLGSLKLWLGRFILHVIPLQT